MASASDYSDYLFKIVLIGNAGVGKTSLLERFKFNSFTPDQVPTISCDFQTRIFEVKNKSVKLSVWDTAGQEKFRAITREFYRRTAAVVFVFSIDSMESFECLPLWLNDVKMIGSQEARMFLVANKSDLAARREVDKQLGIDFATEQGMSMFETSAKTGKNVEKLFATIANQLGESAMHSEPDDTVKVGIKREEKKEGKCCS